MCVQDIWIGRHLQSKAYTVEADSLGVVEISPRARRTLISVLCLESAAWRVETYSGGAWLSLAGIDYTNFTSVGVVAFRQDIVLEASRYGQIVAGPLRLSGPSMGAFAVTEVFPDDALEAAVKEEAKKHVR